MPLTEQERKAAHAVALQFRLNREPTTHHQLLSQFKDPSLIIRLTNSQVFITDTSTGDPKYFPTALTFHYSGDEELLNYAKRAVEVVVRDAKNIFMTNFDRIRRYEVPTFIAQLESANYVPVPEQVALGLYLAKDIPNTIFVSLDDTKTTVVSFQINEHILNQDPDNVWHNYIQAYDRIAQEDRSKQAAAPEHQASIRQSVAQPRQRKPAAKKPQTWLPSRWVIEEHLGEGGQGWTYKVRRSGPKENQLYVLKRLKNKDRLQRFRSEIAVLTKLHHPGILRIIETAEESEEPFFVSEFCEGPDLGKANLAAMDLLARLRVFRQVCDAVAVAHKANILHRDLKPSNIFLRNDGSAVVGDWGLCIDLNDAQERATQTAEAIGARMYIAPEVEMGRAEEPIASSDVYSLGKVLYFILSSRTLLREDYAEPNFELRKDGEPGMYFVYELFDKMLKKNPEDRFENAAELLIALDGVINRILQRAHVLDPYVRQQCVFCGIGEYQRRQASVYELMYVCNNCGNIQKFTGEPPHRKWWE